jgi:hypothetical protein
MGEVLPVSHPGTGMPGPPRGPGDQS